MEKLVSMRKFSFCVMKLSESNNTISMYGMVLFRVKPIHNSYIIPISGRNNLL